MSPPFFQGFTHFKTARNSRYLKEDMAGAKKDRTVKTIADSYPASPMQQSRSVLAWTFPQDTSVACMHEHFQSELKGMASNLSQGLADSPRLAGAEQRQLLAEGRDTPTGFPQDKCVCELFPFETQVERTPNTDALVYIKGGVSYRELDNQAIRVALHLRSLDVGQ